MIKALVRFFNVDGLLKDSSVIFIGMAGAHVFNLFFQMVMGRCLDSAEYALLIAMLGIFNIVMIPLGVISSAMTRYTSLLIHENRRGDVRRLVIHWGGRFVLFGVILSLICFFIPDYIASFFHFERTAPILIFGVILTGLFCRPVIDGVLMGMQCFGCCSFNNLLGWGTRLLVGAVLVIFISPFAGWGLLGHGLGFYVALLSGIIFLFSRLKGIPVTQLPLPEIQGYLWWSFFILLGYSILMMGDVVLVKHLYPESAGDFSYAATLGRLVIFVPQAFVTAMFPKVVTDKIGTPEQLKLYFKTLLITLITTVFSALVFTFMVRVLLKIIYGISDPSEDLLLWSRLLAWIMIPVALLGVSVRFALAQQLFMNSCSVIFLGGIYITASFLYQGGVTFILLVLAALTLIAQAVLFFSITKKSFNWKFKRKSL